MVNITTTSANDPIDMTYPQLVGFVGNLIAAPGNFSWTTENYASGPYSEVDIHGSSFTYSGAGNGRELASGSITRISIDIDNDNGSDTQGDLVITGTQNIIGSNINKNSPRSFWNEVLKGNDRFNLTGLSVAQVGFSYGTIFGDDFAAFARTGGGVTDLGGNDTILGGDNAMLLIGDVNTVAGSQNEFVTRFAWYDAGSDRIISAATDNEIRVDGDAHTVGRFAALYGGDDVLDIRQNTSIYSQVTGDAAFQYGGTVYGGDDRLYLSMGGVWDSGDVSEIFAGALNGGDDVITVGERAGQVAGDVGVIRENAPNEATVDGGDDRILGGPGGDTLAGEVLYHNEVSSIVGGNDTITGGGGDDEIYGEITFGSLAGVSGGNDQLFGGDGADELFGQSGNDRLVGDADNDTLNGGADADTLDGGGGVDRLVGAAGNDRLTGGVLRDSFAFSPGSDIDIITDFVDVDDRGDDLIDARAFGFTHVNQIDREAAGDDLVLVFNSEARVRIIDYLATHTADQIKDDILLV